MQKLASYQNAKGEKFDITFEEPTVAENADYWGFFFVVKDSQDRKRPFRFVVMKSFIADREQAKEFAKQQPLTTLHKQLDNVEDGRGPLFLPDLSKGWEVF
jgi:hypothetical protein